ncbi:MAG: hypothetical protein VX951_08845 [Planctomycetota bacterium]|nr:hypothetical protein [Planctomycetota bacterium]
MSSMPTPPDPREKTSEDPTGQVTLEEMLRKNGYDEEEIVRLTEQVNSVAHRVATGRVDPTQVQLRDDFFRPEGPSIGAATPEQTAAMDREQDRAEWLKGAFGPYHPDDTIGMKAFNSLWYGYSQSGAVLPGVQNAIRETPIVGPTVGAVLGGIERGAISVNNMIGGVFGIDLDYLPTPDEKQEELTELGTMGKLVEGVTQFAFVAVPVAASTPGGWGAWLSTAAAGAVADASAFDPRTGNISTMAREMFPDSPVDKYLAFTDSKEIYELTGSQWYARGMAMAEGFVVGEAAGLTLGGAIGGLRAIKHLGDDIALEASPLGTPGGAGGILNDFNLPEDLAGRKINEQAAQAILKLKNLTLARNARAHALKTQNPGITLEELYDTLSREFSEIAEQPIDLQREAWAGVMEAITRDKPGAVRIGEWRRLARQIDPNKVYLQPGGTHQVMIESLPPAANELFQRAGSATAARATRNMGEGNLSDDMQSQLDAFVQKNGLNDEQAGQVEETLRSRLRDFPTEEWSELELESLKFPKGKKKYSDTGKPNVDIKFKGQRYTFSLADPTDSSSKPLRRGQAEYTQRVDTLAEGIVRDVEESMRVLDDADAGPQERLAAKTVMNAQSWYQAMRDRLGREWGQLAPTFAELLGGLSPRTKVRENFAHAVEVIQHYSRGDYDEIIERYIRFRLDGNKTYDDWVEGGNPVIHAGGKIAAINKNDDTLKQYGINTSRVMDILADQWYSSKFATPEQRATLEGAPKALNFTGNLSGQSVAATIDVWAARMLQRLAGGKAIPPSTEGAVKGNFVKQPTKEKFGLDPATTGAAGGEFGMGQDAFVAAVKLLREKYPDQFAGLGPDDLQAMMWLYEKQRVWAPRGWTNVDGAAGSFDLEADLLMGSPDTLDDAGMRARGIDPEADQPGRVVVGASAITDQTRTPLADTGYTVQRMPTPVEEEKILADAQAALSADNTAVAFTMGRNTGVFLDNAEDSVFIEATFARRPGREDALIPVNAEQAAQLERGEITRTDDGRFLDADGNDVELLDAEGENVVSYSEGTKSRVEYPIEEEPDFMSIIGVAARAGADNGQDSVVVSKILNNTVSEEGSTRQLTMQEMFEQNPNVRRGMEIMFDGPKTEAEIADVLRYLEQNYLGAQTITEVRRGTARATESKDAIVGVRVIDVPEFRLGAEGVNAARTSSDPRAAALEDLLAREQEFDQYTMDLLEMNMVTKVDPIAVDTIVMGQQSHYAAQYGDIVDANGTIREDAQAFRGRQPWYEEAQGPSGRAAEEPQRPAGDEGRPEAGDADDPEGTGDQEFFQRGRISRYAPIDEIRAEIDRLRAAGDEEALEAAERELEAALAIETDRELANDYFTSGETDFLQADDVRGSDPGFTVRGSATVDDEVGVAFIRLFDAADDTTAAHEVGHAVRVHTLGRRAKLGEGSLSQAEIAAAERRYGVEDGNWTREQEEAFADDFMDWVKGGGPRGERHKGLGSVLGRVFNVAAAELKTIYTDAGDSVAINPPAKAIFERIQKLNGLPEQYANRKYVDVPNFTAILSRLEEAEKAGQDWRDVIAPQDILGTARMGETGRLRFDVNTPEDAQKLMAHFGAFSRELMERQVQMRPQTMVQIRQDALESLNALMGRESVDLPQTMREMLGAEDFMFKTQGPDAAHARMLTAQMLLYYKAKGLVELADKARATRNVTDMAQMYRAMLEYQIVQSQVSAAKTTWGRLGQSMQNVKIPGVDELSDPVAADKFLRSIGMAEGGLTGTSDEVLAALAHVQLPEDAATLAQVVKTNNEQVGKVKKTFAILQEIYVNSLLSGAKTFFGLTVTSPVLMTTFLGLSRFAGGAAMALRGDGRGVDQMGQVLRNFRQTFLESMVAAEYTLRTLKTGEATLMPGVGVYDSTVGVGAIHSNSENALVRNLVNYTGTVVRTPSRVISTFDEFFRQVNSRVALNEKFTQEVHDELLDNAIENGTISAEKLPRELREWREDNAQMIAEETRRRVEAVIRDGRIRDQHAILDEAMSDPRIASIEDDFARADAVQEYFAREYTDTHKNNVAYARDHATRAVFQGELEGLPADFQRFMDDKAPVLRFVIPFFRTPVKIQEQFFGLAPTNILAEGASRLVNRASGGTWAIPTEGNLGVLHRRHLEDLASGDPKRIAEARGRQAMGMTLVATSFMLAESGVITGGGPTDYKKRRDMQQSGWQPYSIKVGDKFVSYLGMDPFAQYLALFADSYYMLNEQDRRGPEDEKYSYIAALGIVAARQIHEKPYIQGLSNLFGALGQPERKMETFLSSMLTGFVPFSSMQGAINYATDPYVREARGVLEKVRNKTMFGEGDIEPRYNALGERVATRTENTGDFYHHWWNRIMPFRVSAETDDVVLKTIIDQDISFQPPATVQTIQYGKSPGMKVDLLEIPAPAGSESAEQGWSLYAHWNETINTIELGGRTLREQLEDIVKREDVAMFQDWEETATRGQPFNELISKTIMLYRSAALEKIQSEVPELESEVRRLQQEDLEILQSNADKTYGPGSTQSQEVEKAQGALNKRLEELVGGNNGN